MNNYSSLAAKRAIVANRFPMKSIQQLCVPLVFHVPGETLQVLPLGLFINGLRIDPGTDAPWETQGNINCNCTGLRVKKKKKKQLTSPLYEERHCWRAQDRARTCGKDVKVSFCLAARQHPTGGGEKQLELGDSFSQITFDLPILETFIIKRSFMTAAEGVTWHVWIRSLWQRVSWAACSATLFSVFLCF